ARELAAESGHPRAAQVVAAPGGESYLLFVPHTALAPPPPPLPVSPWMLIVIGAATSLAVSAILAWYLARPIRSLRWAFDAAAGGRLETRVRPLMGRRRDEIADLGRDFDRMAQQLQKLVTAQRRLLHDAVENVVRNAVKYTAPGSTVDIDMRLEVNPPRTVVSVTDRGPGIAPEELGRIFEPFYRGGSDAGGAQGFGLGLAIAQRAIEAHGGQIRAANVEGGGLRMEIALPSFTQG